MHKHKWSKWKTVAYWQREDGYLNNTYLWTFRYVETELPKLQIRECERCGKIHMITIPRPLDDYRYK